MASSSFSTQNNRGDHRQVPMASSSFSMQNNRGDHRQVPMDKSSFDTQNNVVTGSREPDSDTHEKKDEYWRYIPLLKAALSGDWNTAKKFFEQDESAITAPINLFSETALSVAVAAGEKAVHFVENLVELMPVEALALKNSGSQTALHIAAGVGNTKAATLLVRKKPDLVYIRDDVQKLPLHFAARNGCKETLLYLLSVTQDDYVSMPFQNRSSVRLVNLAIASAFYDVALNLVQRYPQLATSADNYNECALLCLARKTSAFPSGSHLGFWQQIIYNYVPVKLENYSIKDSNRGDLENQVNSSQVTLQKKNWAIGAQLLKDFSISVPHIKHIREQKQMHLQALKLLKRLCEEIRSLNDSQAYVSFAKDAIILATRLGVHEVIEEIVEAFPMLIWTRDNDNRGLFHRAVLDRHENVFNLMHQMGDDKRSMTAIRDNDEDTILHLAGRLAPQRKLDLVPGAALQMQRELQWFKEVEKLVWPGYIEWRNNKSETPAMVFSGEHKKLINEGQKWMKDTANSCTILAALIVTVVFAASITVPGGNNSNTGLPIFSKDATFIIFMVSNAISLFTATTSLLMFLSILTSRYAEGDFLYVLPKRLIIGLFTLFLSITSMVVAFSAALYLVLGSNKGWILIPVAVLASLPVTSFVTLQFPLLVDLISSTYGPGIFGKQSDRFFY